MNSTSNTRLCEVCGRLRRWRPRPLPELSDWDNCQFHTAAPDMYEALKVARETIKALHGDIGWAEYQHSPEMRAIDAAVYKAEGRGT